MGLTIFAGCAHLEVTTTDIYPFRAEFTAQGMIEGRKMISTGAIFLTSETSGTVQTYGPAAMASSTIDIEGGKFSLKDMWGRQTGMVTLPVNDLAGLIAGDIPRQPYIYKEKTPGGMRVIYTWGVLYVNDATLPTEIHVPGEPALDVFFKPEGRDLKLEVNYGTDTMKISLTVRQGGRWASS